MDQAINSKVPLDEGTRVTLHLRITLEDGLVAEDTFAEDLPLVFHIGDGTVIGALEAAISTLSKGEKTTVMLSPQDGFGLRDPENIHKMPRSSFGPGMNVAPGLIIGFTTPAGDEVPGAILSADDQEVEVDFNHPLAGHPLNIDVEILDIEDAGYSPEI